MTKQKPLAERYQELLKLTETEMPFLKGLADNHSCDYSGIAMRFGLDPRAQLIRILATIGKPSEAEEASVLHEILQTNLTQPTPAFWVPSWEPQAGIVLSAHYNLGDEPPDPVMGFSIQIEMCAKMARSMRKELLGIDS